MFHISSWDSALCIFCTFWCYFLCIRDILGTYSSTWIRLPQTLVNRKYFLALNFMPTQSYVIQFRKRDHRVVICSYKVDGIISNNFRKFSKLYRSNVLMTNERHFLIINFYSTVFLSAQHVSNDNIHSSSGARHNVLYYTVKSVQSCRRV